MLRLKRIWEGHKKLSHYLDEMKPKKVGLPFGHGMGDTIASISVFHQLIQAYPDIRFTLILQKGLGFEELIADIEKDNLKVEYSSDLSYDKDEDYGYDIIADIDFPMNEGQQELTKGQWCMKHEIGLEIKETVYPKLTCGKNRLILFQPFITCLPGACNVDYDTAKVIWNEILENDFIPMESSMLHVFHNPENKKFDFMDRHVRNIKPRISTLVGLIESCAGIITVVTGPLHAALAVKDPERIFFLEKDFKLESFIKQPKIARADVRNYKGEVKQWLKKIETLD